MVQKYWSNQFLQNYVFHTWKSSFKNILCKNFLDSISLKRQSGRSGLFSALPNVVIPFRWMRISFFSIVWTCLRKKKTTKHFKSYPRLPVCIKWENLEYQRCRNLFIFIWFLHRGSLNPLTAMGDQHRISPYNINTISSRQVRRIERNINNVIIYWSNNKFSELVSKNWIADSKENH